MSDSEKNITPTTPPKKTKRSVWSVIAFALIGIFVVLLISNLSVILEPLGVLSTVLTPIIIGLVIAYIINFFLRFFEYKIFRGIKRRTLNRALSMFFSYVLMLGILAGFLFLIIPSVRSSIEDLEANGMSYLDRVLTSINDLLSQIPFIEKPEDGAAFLTLEKLLNYLFNLLSTSSDWIISNLFSIFGGAVNVLKNILVGLFISVYVLLSKERLNAGCRRIFRALLPEKAEKLVLNYVSRAHSKFGGFMIGKLLDSTMVMLVCMLLFSIFDIPYAILVAVIVGVTDIIPFFGPFLGAIPSALIIFIADPWKAVIFVLLILVVQQIDGNLLAPMILGDRTGLSSLGVIIAVTVMGNLFGIIGMLIGVPVFALLISILDDFISHRLKKKGEPTSLHKYYPADAFIRPQDEDKDEVSTIQRFAHWVRTVKTEKPGEDYTPSFFHTIGRGIRHVLFAIGSFFGSLFSIKPLPPDHQGGVYANMVKNGIPTKHTFWRSFFLTIPTLGFYPYYLIEVIAQGTNIACRKDAKRSWGGISYFLFSIITLGIFPIVWHCKVINRMNEFFKKRNAKCCISKRFYLCWTLIGLPILVGPLIAIARFLRAYREMAALFNSTHTFPLDTEKLAADISEEKDEPRQRISFIDQILATEVKPEQVEDDDDDDYDDEDDNEIDVPTTSN